MLGNIVTLLLAGLCIWVGVPGCSQEARPPEPAAKSTETVTSPSETEEVPSASQEQAAAPASSFAPQPNHPPRIVSAKIFPEVPVGNSAFRVEVEAEDPDGDRITYAYQWVKGKEGERSAEVSDIEGETGPTLSQAKITRGDLVAVKVTPSDWYGSGDTFQTQFMKIVNFPPRIVSTPPEGPSQEQSYRYQVEAVDPDGDPLLFSLAEGAPPGMSIDSKTGLVTWAVSGGKVGSYSYTITVEDGQGGTCSQQVTGTLGGKAAAPPESAP